MDAKRAAQIIKSGNFSANDFQTLYAALNGKAEFAEEFAFFLRMRSSEMLALHLYLERHNVLPSDCCRGL